MARQPRLVATFKVTYFAPYTHCAFEAQAPTLRDGVKKFRAFNEAHGYSIPRREIKAATYAGRDVPNNKL